VNAVLQIYNFVIHLTVQMRGYLLALMSVDRCLAAVRPMTQLVAVIAALTGAMIIGLLSSPTLILYHVVHYEYSEGQMSSLCTWSSYFMTYQRYVPYLHLSPFQRSLTDNTARTVYTDAICY